jgi:hypothetical protein
LSIQSIALSYGVWISQLIIRQNAPPGGGHGNPNDGMPEKRKKLKVEDGIESSWK